MTGTAAVLLPSMTCRADNQQQQATQPLCLTLVALNLVMRECPKCCLPCQACLHMPDCPAQHDRCASSIQTEHGSDVMHESVTLQPLVRFLMSQLPPCSRPGMVLAASLAAFLNSSLLLSMLPRRHPTGSGRLAAPYQKWNQQGSK